MHHPYDGRRRMSACQHVPSLMHLRGASTGRRRSFECLSCVSVRRLDEGDLSNCRLADAAVDDLTPSQARRNQHQTSRALRYVAAAAHARPGSEIRASAHPSYCVARDESCIHSCWSRPVTTAEVSLVGACFQSSVSPTIAGVWLDHAAADN